MFHLLRRLLLDPASEPAMSSTVTISSATLDKDNYAAGDTMTLTVVRSATATTETTQTLTVSASDASGTQASPITVTTTVDVTAPEASTVAVADDSGRSWTAGADDRTTAVFTATA